MKIYQIIFFILAIIFNDSISLAVDDVPKAVPDEIRYEAILPNGSDVGYPLPLAGHWNTGQRENGFSPDYQINMIEKGHYLLPWFQLPDPYENTFKYVYYESAIRKASKMKLPISFISTQWERYLSSRPEYYSLLHERNPNIVDTDGLVLRKVSPFGPSEPWRDVGKKWTANPMIRKLQEWYPDPPLVLFVSNNEHGKLRWKEIEQDYRYLSVHGSFKEGNFKRKMIGDGWIKRYRTLQKGMLEGLTSPSWKSRSVFTGYEAFGGSAFGRWGGWIDYSLYIPGRMEPWPLAWDGASVPYYVFNWDSTTDFKVWSPQVQAMNWVFMLEEARQLNKNFRFELSTWDGHELKMDNDKRKYYAKLGQVYNPGRYEGYVQFGMWLLRPNTVREFRGWTDTLTNAEPYFLSIVNSVDRVHTDPILRKFWRKGQLVANRNHPHPYQSDIPTEYQSKDRWFLLDTNLDPARPWTLNKKISVFSLALVLGNSPEREWLVYAHSPLKVFNNVKITVPGYGFLMIDVAPSGYFYHILEKGNVVKRIYFSIPSPPTEIMIN